MRFVLTARFRTAYRVLPEALQRKTEKAIGLLAGNAAHPSLRLNKIKGAPGIWEARVDKNCRMTLEIHSDTFILRNVGKHDETLDSP